MLWRKKCKIKALHVDNLKGLLGIRRMDSTECMDKRTVWNDENKFSKKSYLSRIWIMTVNGGVYHEVNIDVMKEC